MRSAITPYLIVSIFDNAEACFRTRESAFSVNKKREMMAKGLDHNNFVWDASYQVPLFIDLPRSNFKRLLDTIGVVSTIGKMTGDKKLLKIKAMMAILKPHNEIMK